MDRALESVGLLPDPIVEKSRKHIVYDPSQLDQSGEKRELKELRPGHFVLANSREFAAYEEKIGRLEKERAATLIKQTLSWLRLSEESFPRFIRE